MKINNKLFCFIILTSIVSILTCATGTSYARQEQKENLQEQEDPIVNVIQGLAANIERRLPQNTRLAVVNVSSESAVFSDYVIEELISAFMENGKLMIVDRNALHLALARSEMNFQLSGDVSEETQQSIGKMLGAQSILSASLIDMGDAYRLRTAVIRVETLAREATVASDVQKSGRVEFLMKTNEPVTRRRVDNPVTASDFKRRGNEYMNDTQEYDRAIADFSEAIKLKPLDADAYILRADAYHILAEKYRGKNYYNLAIADYSEALRLVPAYAYAYLNRGRIYIEVGDYKRAEEDLARAIQLDPNNAVTLNHIGILRYRKKDYQGAVEAYTQALKLRTYPFTYSNRAAAYFHLGDKTRCLQDLERAFQLAPDKDLNRERIEALKMGVWILD